MAASEASLLHAFNSGIEFRTGMKWLRVSQYLQTKLRTAQTTTASVLNVFSPLYVIISSHSPRRKLYCLYATEYPYITGLSSVYVCIMYVCVYVSIYMYVLYMYVCLYTLYVYIFM